MNDDLDLDDVGQRIPGDVHVTMLTDRDVVTREMLAYPLLWSDRPYSQCPRCTEPVDTDLTDKPPAILDGGACQGGQVLDIDQKHGCGEWLSVDSESFERDDVTADELVAAAVGLSQQRAAAIEMERVRIIDGLRELLADAYARLTDQVVEGESWEDRVADVCTGSEVEPGVCFENDVLIAWNYHPTDPSEPIIVRHDSSIRKAGTNR